MQKIKLTSFLLVASLCFTSLYAQTNVQANNLNISKTDSVKTVEREQYAGGWVLGFGVNAVQDDGIRDFDNTLLEPYSHFSNPFIISAEYYTSNCFSFNTSLSFNKYKAGKIVDGGIIQEGDDPLYMAFDISTKYSFRELFKSKSFEPYFHVGVGFTNIGSHISQFKDKLIQIPSIARFTVNAGLGSNFWFSETLGLNLNFSLKNGVNSKKYKDYISAQAQYSISALYRFKNN